MDEFLPSEILAKIASNLSYQDVNSLLRTSKTAHAKLTPYRHILPKMSCQIVVDRDGDKICLEVDFDFKNRLRVKKPNFLCKKVNFYDHIASGFTEEEDRDRVVQFYKGRRDATEEEKTFRGRLEGLSLHIQTIKAFASIEVIQLIDVDDDLVLEELARLMRPSRSRIFFMYIRYSKNFTSSNLDLITACKPRYLSVDGEVLLPDNFYNLPAVQRLDQFYHDSHEKTVHNLSLLSASHISINKSHNITIDDIEQIIVQWAESKRSIRFIGISTNSSLDEQKCRAWIEHLDNGLFEAKLVIHKESEWILTRCCDCKKITFRIAHDSLDIDAV